jgi:hypothetical protein
MGQRFDASDSRLYNPGGVHHYLIRLRDFDRAWLGDVGLAREHVRVVPVKGRLLLTAMVQDFATEYPTPACATAAGHAGVRHGDLCRLQRLQQISARFDSEDPVQRLYEDFHVANPGADSGM